MQTTTIDFSKIILRIIMLIIVKPLILPFQIYKNTLVNLSNSDDENSNEKLLVGEFPLYVWFIDLFDAVIAICYPIGLIFAIYSATTSYFGGFATFLGITIVTYFIPLLYGLIKELLSITLKTLNYLKTISNK